MPTNPPRPDEFDQALICENGHVVTAMLRRSPERYAPFCETCGKPTLKECPQCNQPIPGYHFGGFSTAPYLLPAYCRYCSQAFPWQQKTLEAARRTVDSLDELTPEERADLKTNIEEIATESPGTEVAARGIKKVIDRLSGSSARILEKVATDVATEIAKAVLRGG